jgi:hypothetical protein
MNPEHKVIEYTSDRWVCTCGVKGYNNSELLMHFSTMEADRAYEEYLNSDMYVK